MHKSSITNTNDSCLKCETCGKIFSTKQNLAVHSKTAKYCLKLRGESVGNTCEYCDRVFSRKFTLKRHMETCVKYKNVSEETAAVEKERAELGEIIETLDYENEIYKLENEGHKKIIGKLEDENAWHIKEQKILQVRIAKLESVVEEQKDKILRLEKNIERGKGMIMVYEKNSKKPNITINTTTKQKLSMIPTSNIRPLTIKAVNEDLYKYTKDLYVMKEDGVVKFIQGMIELKIDGVTERNYACTDSSRNTFYRLLESKEWKRDGGARFISEILDTIAEPGKEYYAEMQENHEKLGSCNPKYFEDGPKIADQNLFQLGLENISDNRNSILTKIKTKIKDFTSV